MKLTRQGAIRILSDQEVNAAIFKGYQMFFKDNEGKVILVSENEFVQRTYKANADELLLIAEFPQEDEVKLRELTEASEYDDPCITLAYISDTDEVYAIGDHPARKILGLPMEDSHSTMCMTLGGFACFVMDDSNGEGAVSYDEIIQYFNEESPDPEGVPGSPDDK